METTASDKDPRIDSAKEAFLFLDKVIRGYRIYDAEHVTVKQFETKLHEKLSALLEGHGDTDIGVKAHQFLLGTEVIYENHEKQDNVTYQLYQDGIRQLTFLQGIQLEELQVFLRILRTDFSSFEFSDDDIVTLLWKSGLDHISYVVVETFVETKAAGQTMDEVLTNLSGALLQNTTPHSMHELLAKGIHPTERKIRKTDLEELSSIPPLHTAGEKETDAEIQKVQKDLEGDDQIVVQRMILILFRVLLGEEKQEDFGAIASVLRKLYESSIKLGRFLLASRVLSKLRELANPKVNPSATNAKLIATFYMNLQDSEALSLFRVAVTSPTFTNLTELPLFVRALSPSTAQNLFEIFLEVSRGDVRQAFLEPLAKLLPDSEICSKALRSQDADLVVDVLDILSKMGSERAATLARRAFRHENHQVRAKVLQDLAPAAKEVKEPVALAAIQDPQRIIRMMGLQLLSTIQDKTVAEKLFGIIESSDFNRKDREEKKQFAVALGRIGRDNIFEFFADELKGGLLDRSGGALERRLAAAAALHAIGSDAAKEALERESSRKLAPKALKDECLRLLKRWKRTGDAR